MTAHGCVREEGVSAIEKFILIHQALMELEKKRNANPPAVFSRYNFPYTLNIGYLEAGDNYVNVPASLMFEGELRIGIREDSSDARRQFEEVIAEVAEVDPWLRNNPPVVEWWGGWWSPADIPVDHPLVTTLTSAYSDANEEPGRVEGMPYGADMGTLVNIGKTPTVIFGPGDIRKSHKPDEYVPVDELEKATRALALGVLRFCGYE
jgi:acetylornithine deacetylase